MKNEKKGSAKTKAPKPGLVQVQGHAPTPIADYIQTEIADKRFEGRFAPALRVALREWYQFRTGIEA